MKITLYVLGLVWLTWLLYIAVMAMKRVKDAGKATIPMKVMGYPILLIGVLADVLLNVIVCSVLFAEMPKEWFVTTRLNRLNDGTDWRARLSNWIAVNLLDAFDPSGKHVK